MWFYSFVFLFIFQKKKKVDAPTTIIDESAQIAQSDKTACCSSDKTSKSALGPDSENFFAN